MLNNKYIFLIFVIITTAYSFRTNSIKMKLGTNPNNGICLPNFVATIHNMDNEDQIICINTKGEWRGVQECKENTLSYYLPDKGNRYNHLTCFLPCLSGYTPDIDQNTKNPLKYPSCIITQIPMQTDTNPENGICSDNRKKSEIHSMDNRIQIRCVLPFIGYRGVDGCKGNSLDYYIPDNENIERYNFKTCFLPCPSGYTSNIDQTTNNPLEYPSCIVKRQQIPMQPDLNLKNTICSLNYAPQKYDMDDTKIVTCMLNKLIQTAKDCKNGSLGYYIPKIYKFKACFLACPPNYVPKIDQNTEPPTKFPLCIIK